jgi:hypothetical protein
LPPEVTIGEHQWVIFCKKNSKDLQKLLEKIEGHASRVIVDDEADYATPNAKINRQEKSRINELTGELIGEQGIYIGVTATPGRLDLNRTKGFIGKSQMEVAKYPDAIHHINIFVNDTGKARIFYKYNGSIRFLKTTRR